MTTRLLSAALALLIGLLSGSREVGAEADYYQGRTGSSTSGTCSTLGGVLSGTCLSALFSNGTTVNPSSQGGTSVNNGTNTLTFGSSLDLTRITTPGQIPTFTPADAGVGLLSAGATLIPPTRLGVTSTSLGFGVGITTPELQVVTNTPGNTLGITNTNLLGIASVTLRGLDNSYTDNTTVFEHGAFFWLPGEGVGSNQGLLGIEASRYDTHENPLIPPPDFQIQQTGGIDPTGGTTQTCSITSTSTAVTCGSNLPANGSLITGIGTDIPAATTLVSGVGTTSGVMSKAATATNASASLKFSNPTYAVRTVMNSIPGANLNFPGWDRVTNILSLDRINNRVGILSTAPQFSLDVGGSARVNGSLNFVGGGIITGSTANTLQVGGPDTATITNPITIAFPNIITGTTDTSGRNVQIKGSQGTGTGSGGALSLQTAPAGTTGTTQNAEVTRFSVLTGGQAIVGNSLTSFAVTNAGGNPIFQVQNNGSSSLQNAAAVYAYRASDTVPASLYLSQSKSSTLGTQAAVVSGGQLGQIVVDGSDGTAFQDSVKLLAAADGAVSAGVVPGRLSIQTANASGALTQAMRWDSAQLATFGGGMKNANLSTGTNADTVCLAADGTFLVQAASCTISSIRFKTLHADLVPSPRTSLADIMRLRPATFTMKPAAHPNPDINYAAMQDGLTAENVAAVMPRCAIYEQDGVTPKSYRQECVIANLVGAVQALAAERR